MLVCTLYTINSVDNSIVRQWADFIEPFDSSFGGYKNSTHIKVETIDCSVFPSSVRASSNFPRWSFVLDNEPIQVNELSPTTISEILEYSFQKDKLNNDVKNNSRDLEVFTREEGFYVKFKDAYIEVGGEMWNDLNDDLNDELSEELENLPQYRISSYCENDGKNSSDDESDKSSDDENDSNDDESESNNDETIDHSWLNWMGWLNWTNW